MKEDFVTYEISKMLKEKGFPLVDYIPTIYQVLKWLREEKKIHMIIDISEEGWFFNLRCLKTGYIMDCTILGFSDTYKQAAVAGIEYVIDNLI